MHCNVKTRCEALKALAQKKLGTDDPAVVEITRGGKNRSHHVLRRSDMKKVGLIAGGAFVALTALNVYSHYKLHQKIADRKLKKQLAPLNAQLDELRTENEALRQALAELKPGLFFCFYSVSSRIYAATAATASLSCRRQRVWVERLVKVPRGGWIRETV